MTLPPTGDESTVPGDLRNVLRRMFKLHGTHKATRLHSGTGRGERRLTRCEEAKPVDSFSRELAAHLNKNRSKRLPSLSASATPRQRHQVADEIEDCKCEDLVIQELQHHDPAAQYHPVEARDIATLQWASFVECSVRERTTQKSLASTTISNEDAQEQINDAALDRVHLIRFNRRPKELHKQLAHSPSLRACREALRIEGFDWKLSSGPSLFVHPWQYVSVVQALPEHGMGNSDVVVTESLEYLLEECLSNAGKGVWAKTRETVALTGAASSSCQVSTGTGRVVQAVRRAAEEWFETLEASRTFLCVAAPRRNTASVVQSATNSRIQAFANPRRVP